MNRWNDEPRNHPQDGWQPDVWVERTRAYLRSRTLDHWLMFAGGLLIIKPQFDLAVLPALVGAASAVFAGGAYTLLRYLRDREPPETVVSDSHRVHCHLYGDGAANRGAAP